MTHLAKRSTSTSSRSINAGRKSKSTDTEDSVESHLIRQAKKCGGITVKLSATLHPGIPDRMVLLPNGVIAFAELKRPKGGRFEPLQPVWLRKLARLGFTVAVPRTRAEVDELLEALCSKSM